MCDIDWRDRAGGARVYGDDRVNQVTPDHKIAREETFGPLLSIFTFKDEAEAIKR